MHYQFEIKEIVGGGTGDVNEGGIRLGGQHAECHSVLDGILYLIGIHADGYQPSVRSESETVGICISKLPFVNATEKLS